MNKFRKIAALAAMFILSGGSLLAQSSLEQAKAFVAGGDYEKAAQAVVQAVKDAPQSAEANMLAGDIYFELDKFDSAMIFYRGAEKAEPKSSAIQRKIGRALIETGKGEEAVTLFRKLSKDDPKDLTLQLGLADALTATKKNDEAELLITKLKSSNPKSPEPLIALGNLYFAQEVFELARGNFEQALELDPSNLDARTKVAQSYFRLANREQDAALQNELYSRSLQEWNKITKEDPSNSRAFYEQGRILYFARKYRDAANSLFQFVNLRPNNSSLGRWYLAQSLYEIRNADSTVADSAVIQLKMVASELDSVKDKAQLLLARTYFDRKNFQAAYAAFGPIKDKIHDNLIDVERYGASAYRAGDTATAIASFQEVIDKDPSKCTLMFQLGNVYRERKEYDKAVATFRKRLSVCNDSLGDRVRWLIGVSFFSANKLDSAIAVLGNAIEINPNNLLARNMLANSYMAQKNTASAQEQLLKIVEIGKTNPVQYKGELSQAYGTLSNTALQAKDFGKVLQYGKSWTETDPNAIGGYLYTAVGYQGSGDAENAKKYYREVLKRDPNNKPAKDSLKQLEGK